MTLAVVMVTWTDAWFRPRTAAGSDKVTCTLMMAVPEEPTVATVPTKDTTPEVAAPFGGVTMTLSLVFT